MPLFSKQRIVQGRRAPRILRLAVGARLKEHLDGGAIVLACRPMERRRFVNTILGVHVGACIEKHRHNLIVVATGSMVQRTAAVSVSRAYGALQVVAEREQHLDDIAESAFGCPEKRRGPLSILHLDQLFNDGRRDLLEHLLKGPHSVATLHGQPDHPLILHELLLAQASPRREAPSHVSVQEATCGALDLVNELGVLVQLLEGLEHRGGGRVESGEDASSTLLRRARRRT